MSAASDKVSKLIALAAGEGEEARTAAWLACKYIREHKMSVTGGVEKPAPAPSTPRQTPEAHYEYVHYPEPPEPPRPPQPHPHYGFNVNFASSGPEHVGYVGYVDDFLKAVIEDALRAGADPDNVRRAAAAAGIPFEGASRGTEGQWKFNRCIRYEYDCKVCHEVLSQGSPGYFEVILGKATGKVLCVKCEAERHR